MTSEEREVRKYLQSAHDRGGGWQMAMFMMARRIEVLQDKLVRAGLSVPEPADVARD